MVDQRRFCYGTPILVKIDKSPEADKNLGKSGSRINNHLFLTRPVAIG